MFPQARKARWLSSCAHDDHQQSFFCFASGVILGFKLEIGTVDLKRLYHTTKKFQHSVDRFRSARKKHEGTACVMYPARFTWTIGVKSKTRIMKGTMNSAGHGSSAGVKSAGKKRVKPTEE